MKQQNILDEPKEGPQTTIGGKFSLTEQMINKKHFEKYKGDIKKIKGIVADMQLHVQEH